MMKVHYVNVFFEKSKERLSRFMLWLANESAPENELTNHVSVSSIFVEFVVPDKLITIMLIYQIQKIIFSKISENDNKKTPAK